MKNLETFFELSNYDSKNITNKGTATISQQHLEKIETQGVTLEFLQSMNVPVFKYRTQITIHGLFPELQHNYLGGYKMLFQNKNLSIGVKWQAVDYTKKDYIYSTVKNFCKDWRRQHNSSEFFIYKMSETFTDKETYKTLLAAAQNEISHIDKTLFFGNAGVYLSQTLWGGYFLVSFINIGAILQTNVDKCIENICKASIGEILGKIAAEKLQKETDEAAQKELDRIKGLEYAAKKAPILEAARKYLTDAGYIQVEKKPIENDSIFIKIVCNVSEGVFKFGAYKFTKETRQKKFRVQESETSENLTFKFSEYSRPRETMQTTSGGWVKVETKPTPQPENKPTVKPTENISVAGLQIVTYSERAVAIFGDTKPIKETLKQLGGRFNMYLQHEGKKQAGWIFAATQLSNLKQTLQIN